VQTPDALTELFRARGLKVTPQRQRIFAVLHSSDVHPTAEAVFAAARATMPTLALKTVYQTLNDLAAMGELQPLDLGTGATRFDANVAPTTTWCARRAAPSGTSTSTTGRSTSPPGSGPASRSRPPRSCSGGSVTGAHAHPTT
jgi:hypothetical protein